MLRVVPLIVLAATLLLGIAQGAPAASSVESVACDGPCTIHVFKLGTGAGVVRSPDDTGLDCGARCEMGTDYDVRVTLRATASQGSVFTGWVGDCEATVGNDCRVHMVVGPVKYYAVFDRIGDPPTPLLEPDTGVTPPPAAPPPPTPAPTPPPEAVKYGGCTHFGTAGSDELDGSSGRDVFCGFGGSDHIHAGGGGDVVLAGSGNDVIETHGGGDRVEGGAGADVIHGGGGNDTLIGGSGRDRIYGEQGHDEIRARDRATDFLHGGTGVDRVRADRQDRLRAIERRL